MTLYVCVCVCVCVSALHRCGREGDVQACRVLLQYGVDPSIISLQGYTATQVSTDSVQRLLHGKSKVPEGGGGGGNVTVCIKFLY